MSGWFGYGSYGGDEKSPEDAAYGRVTNAERFFPLHTTMLGIIGGLENDFEVERTEGHGLDKALARDADLARSDVKLVPANPGAAPITVVFPLSRVSMPALGGGTRSLFLVVVATPAMNQRRVRSTG